MCRRREALGFALIAAGAGILFSLLLPGCTGEAVLGILLIVSGICISKGR